MAERHDDDEVLLSALTVALRPAAVAEPSPAELAAFRRVVAAQAVAGRSRWSSGRACRWVAGLLVGGVVLSGGTAYATNPVAPRPVRSAAFALKLPVESPELTDAKDALADLEEELREGRRDKVAAEVEDVVDELADLSPAGRQALEPRASTLLATARAFLSDPRTADCRASADESDRDGDDVDRCDGVSDRGSGSDDGDSSGSGSSDTSGRGRDDGDSSGSGSGGDDGDSSGSGTDDGDSSDSSGSGSGGDDGDTSDSSGSGSDDGESSGSDSSDSDSSGSGSGGSDSDSSGGGSGSDSDDDDGGVSASGEDRAALDDGRRRDAGGPSSTEEA